MAEAEIGDTIPDPKTGASRRQQLEAVYRQTGKKPKSMRTDPPPEGTAYLWGWFCELGDCSYTEIHHWAALKRIHLLPWEVDVLRHLDHLRSKAWHDRNSASRTSR